MSQMTVTSRPYYSEEDFWRVRRLIIDTYPITPTGLNWDMRRWDGWNTHRSEPRSQSALAHLVRLWETTDGQTVGAAHPEGEGDCYLEIHPDFRRIEAEMLAWAEANLAVDNDGARQLNVFCFDYDEFRRHLLAARGYQQTTYGDVMRRQRFGNQPLPHAELASGYTLRSTRPHDDGDCQKIADLLNAAFNRAIHTAAEYRHFTECSPSFRHDLNLVAEAPDGLFAAHVGVNFEPTHCYGIFEPVCTHPDHQRKGLARALMLEGLHRLRVIGARDAYVGTGDGMTANFLYEVVGFTEVYHGSVWRKTF